jgi:hypothetical protein
MMIADIAKKMTWKVVAGTSLFKITERNKCNEEDIKSVSICRMCQ